jgi:hypothetical protein
VGFNHFFRGANDANGGDLVYFQPHSAPGVLRAGLPRRFSRRSASRALPTGNHRCGPVFLPAPVADAGLLAVPDRLDGYWADQLDLPGALHALPAEPRTATHGRPQGVGLFRRWRNGRTRGDRRTVAGAREGSTISCS